MIVNGVQEGWIINPRDYLSFWWAFSFILFYICLCWDLYNLICFCVMLKATVSCHHLLYFVSDWLLSQWQSYHISIYIYILCRLIIRFLCNLLSIAVCLVCCLSVFVSRFLLIVFFLLIVSEHCLLSSTSVFFSIIRNRRIFSKAILNFKN